MAKSNHTPGPWRVSHDHGNNILRDTDTGPQMIGSAYYTNDPSPSYKDRQETLANARLMAAAPELLEACRALLLCAERGITPRDVARQARKAIEDAR